MLDKIRKSSDHLFQKLNFLDDPYKFVIIAIIFLSFFLRFYNFPNSWGIGDDDSRDVAIAREAIVRHELPPTGPFSSAGAFVVGPTFYWMFMVIYIIMPFSLASPWIVTNILGVILVVTLIYCGYLIGGRKLALVIGILSATSPQLILHSRQITNTSFLLNFAGFLLLSYIYFFRTKKYIFSFLTGLFFGLCLSVHYSALNLAIFLPLIMLTPKITLKKRVVTGFIFILGAIIPNLPIIFWDSAQSFSNTRNILQYFLIDQYRLFVPNSWKLFVFKYFPSAWAFVAGNFSSIGFGLMALSVLIAIIYFVKKQFPKEMLYLGIAFAVLVFINRYYHGERSESYLTYFLNFIMIFTGFSIVKLYEFKKILGIIIIGFVLIGNFYFYNSYVKLESGVKLYKEFVSSLVNKYPGKRITVYDYQSKAVLWSQPVGLFLSDENRKNKGNINIGMVCVQKCSRQNLPKIGQVGGAIAYDLSSVKDISQNHNWTNVSQEGMYDSLVGFTKGHNLTSNFSLIQYLKQRL